MGTQRNFISTYRVQFSPCFTFSDAEDLVPHLRGLRISHLYASPVMEAVPGSMHGYDVTDFSSIREELGGEQQFTHLSKIMKEHGIGWIQDFVPNHMAMDPRNPYIWDIFEKGVDSPFSGIFDIYWGHPDFPGGKLCAPFLEKPYSTELKYGKFSLSLEKGIVLRYNELEFPIRESTYTQILGKDLSRIAVYLKKKYGCLVSNGSKNRFRNSEEDSIQLIREKLGKSSSDAALIDRVIASQPYSLRYWRSTAQEINYRRFFAVNGLICIKEEDRNVFETVHEKLLALIDEQKMDGVRIDHVDGLFDPEGYLTRLRQAAGDSYIVVEKILESREKLDENWPVQGTTGYDFLGRVSSVMVSEEGLSDLDSIYRKFSGTNDDLESTIYSLKLKVIDTLFPAVINLIAALFWNGVKKIPSGKHASYEGMKLAIREMLARTPLYRTYLAENEQYKHYLVALKSILQSAESSRSGLDAEFRALNDFIEGKDSEKEALGAVMVLQQYMPAVYAKSIEDTLFFRYNRLISLNEVGSDPIKPQLNVENFHDFNRYRAEKFPMSMNALSTHDTKLSEDIRARINVLSEIPNEWGESIESWHEANLAYAPEDSCPSRNEEYYIYQLLLGSYPFSDESIDSFGKRFLAHLMKSIREAGVNTGWDAPDIEYEKNYGAFVRNILEGTRMAGFAEKFKPVFEIVSFHGFLNSITQKVLQMTAPGVPDVYQGTEIWNFSFVDPDNRRKVDFQRIMELGKQVEAEFSGNRKIISSYLENFTDGRIKFLVTSVLLKLRNERPKLFSGGAYRPIRVDGKHRKNIIAFCRLSANDAAVVVVPRLTVSLGRLKLPIGKEVWGEDVIAFPDEISGHFEDIFTGKHYFLKSGKPEKLGDILEIASFSVLVLKDDAIRHG